MFNGLERIGFRKPCFHHYNFAYPGDQDEGIRRRIRQGGGSKKIEPSADVHGHCHLPEYEKTERGDSIFVKDISGTGGKWEIKVEHLSGHEKADTMIRQDNLQVIGAEFQGIVVKKIG